VNAVAAGSAAALRILDRSPHQLCDRELNISLVDDPAENNDVVMDEIIGNDSEALSCAIEVRDIAPDTKEVLSMFFQNRKRSGGDKIEDIIYYDEEHRAVVTFASPKGTVDLAFIYE